MWSRREGGGGGGGTWDAKHTEQGNRLWVHNRYASHLVYGLWDISNASQPGSFMSRITRSAAKYHNREVSLSLARKNAVLSLLNVGERPAW